jgi:hypothetical protein
MRPDISYAIGVLSHFTSNPGPAHWKAVKHLCCYLKGTADSIVGKADVLDSTGKPREQAKENEIEVCRDIILHIPREQAKENEIEV